MAAITTITQNGQIDKEIAKLIPAELKKDKAFLNFSRSIHSLAYMELATFNLRKYMKYRNIKKCDRLVNEEPRVIETKISEFLADGCKQISNNSKRVVFANLKLFYTQNDVMLNWSKLSKRIGPRERNNNRAYHTDEITKMLNHADHRGRVVIHLFCATGMRINAIPNLNIQDLKPIEKEGQKMYAITVYKGEPEQYITFCTPECTKSIDAYLAFRRTIKEPMTSKAPLIRNQVDIETADANPDNRIAKRATESSIRHILEKVVLGCGLKESLNKTKQSDKVTRYEAHLSRGFRKFCFKAMTKANIQATHRHALIGHKDGINNIEASSLAMTYDSPEESELFTSYLKAIDFLTIDQTQTLTKQNEDLKDKLDTATVTRREFDELKLELLEMFEKEGSIPIKHMKAFIEYRKSKMTPEQLEANERAEREYSSPWDMINEPPS